jgi:hypothetical protein
MLQHDSVLTFILVLVCGYFWGALVMLVALKKELRIEHGKD